MNKNIVNYSLLIRRSKEKENEYIKKQGPLPPLYIIACKVVAEVALALSIRDSPSDSSKLASICNFLQDLVSSRTIKLSEVSVLAVELYNNAAAMSISLLHGSGFQFPMNMNALFGLHNSMDDVSENIVIVCASSIAEYQDSIQQVK